MSEPDIREQNMVESKLPQPAAPPDEDKVVEVPTPKPAALPPEVGGAPGPEPTRYGDWQHKGRVTDF